MTKPELWTRDFITASCVSFFQGIVFYMLLVVIAGYAVQQLHATTTQAGIISGLFIVGMLAGRLFVNKFVNRFGRKQTLWTTLILFLLSSGLYFFSNTIEALTSIRFIHGVSFGMANSILGTIVAQIIPATRRGEGIGYYSLSITLGAALGPFLGIFLILNASYQAIFITSIISSVLACLVCFNLRIPPLAQKTAPNLQKQNPSFMRQLIEPAALPIGLIIFICSICYAGVLSFITFYAAELNITKAATVFFLVYAIAIVLSRPFTGNLMDKYGENIVMYPALITLAVGFLTLAFTQNGTQLLISGALFGFGFGNLQSIGQAIAIKSAPIERIGLSTTTFFIALDAGFGFGPFLLGALLIVLSYSQMYLLCATVVSVCIGLYYVLHGRKLRQ